MNFSAMREYLDQIPSMYGTPGGSVRVWQDHRELFRHDFGIRDIDTSEPMRGDEITDLFSCTKPVTAVAVMQLLEQGKIGVNDRLSMYFPEFDHLICYSEPNGNPHPPQNPVTLRHLLTMTAGFTYDMRTPAISAVLAEKGSETTTQDVIRAMAKSPLFFEPGTHWRYSECLDILAGVVEVASGERFSEYVKHHIFEPLGMVNSGFHYRSDMADRYVHTYDEAGAEKKLKKRSQIGSVFSFTDKHDSGGGGLISGADDYIRFADMLACGGTGLGGSHLLAPETVDLMRTNALTEEMRRDMSWDQLQGYGYGYGVRTLVDRVQAGSLGPVGEFGWDGLKGAYLICDRENSLSLFYLEQTGRCKEKLHPRLRNLLYYCMQCD